MTEELIEKPGKIAIISDVHGNADALASVLDDISLREIRQIYCLGDIVGYCGQTVEAVDLVKEHAIQSCAGNHEDGLKFALAGANEGGLTAALSINLSAAKSIVIASQQLKEAKQLPEKKPVFENPEKRMQFLAELPDEIRVNYNAKGLHALKDKNGYPRYLALPSLMERLGIKDKNICQNPENIIFNPRIFPVNIRYIFSGHTHVPYAFIIAKNRDIQSYFPERTSVQNGIIGEFSLKERERAIVVAGSVGIARQLESELFADKNGKINFLPADYAIFDVRKNLVQFVEVYYSVQNVAAETRASGMPDIFSAMEEAR